MKIKIKLREILQYSSLILIIGLVVSWIAGTSPYKNDGYDILFFYIGIGITVFIIILMVLHSLFDQKIKLIGFSGGLLMLIFVFGYIPLRMIYWSVPESWVLIIFPGLIALSIVIPYVNFELSKKLEGAYLRPFITTKKNFWRVFIIWAPIIGVMSVTLSRVFNSSRGYVVFSILGLIVYVGMLWTIQVNIHKNLYSKDTEI